MCFSDSCCAVRFFKVWSVDKCYIGVEDTYANPRTLSFPDLTEVISYMTYMTDILTTIFQVVSFKLIDCNKAHYPKETIQFVTILFNVPPSLLPHTNTLAGLMRDATSLVTKTAQLGAGCVPSFQQTGGS